MSSSFRSILQQVTQEKLEELKLQKNLMSSHFSPVLSQKETLSPGKPQLSLLYSAVKGSPVKDSIDPILLENLKSLLEASEQDPSISDQLVGAWTSRVQGEVEYALRKCEYSYLYGSLLSEWLELEEKRRRKGEDVDMEVGDKKDDSSAVAREKTIANLKALLFKAPTEEEFSPDKFRHFLSQELFSFGDNVAGEAVLHSVIKETGDFFSPENYYISTHDVQCCIKGLCSEELLSPEKKAALKELSDNPEALEEVASLLTTRLKNLDRWEWPSNIGAEVTEIRRGLAGEYQPFLNEDIITALFLQYVGVEWGAYFKRQFFSIYDSKGWVKVDAKPDSVEGYRANFYRNALLSCLPDSVASQENRNQEEYAKVESEECIMMDAMPNVMRKSKAMAQTMAFSAPAPSFGFAGGQARNARSVQPPPPPMPKPDIDFKQQFLHVLTTEIKLNSVLRPEQPLLVVQADLECFGPSVIHDAALIALEFLGVKKEWLNFFRKFLQPKIRFSKDDPEELIRRGVPSAHALSKLFGETLLFLQDFLVNRKCSGMRLYRISDELWFWSHVPQNVTQAWETLHTYGKMVGLKVNEARSGSASVFSESTWSQKFPGESGVKLVPGPSPLPQKNIHWGYLQLTSNGIFAIDDKAVAKFLEEMKGLLDRSECVLEWINIFNKYFTFFIRNFGKSAVASGKQHLDQIVGSLNTIYAGLLGRHPDPVTLLRARFPSQLQGEIVDAWVYWPLERGGLGLVNPFIAVMALRQSFAEAEKGSPLDLDFSKLPQQDRQTWEDLKKEWERMYGSSEGQGQLQGRPVPVGPSHRPTKLPSWQEYVGSRETELWSWYSRYVHLLERPGPKYPLVSEGFHTLGWSGGEETQRNYFMWLFSYYETQLVAHFGSVTFINAKLLPMSMIGNIQKAKVLHN